ncbi:hypothetical protein ACQY0O_004254 [Thecaphora frezii]
MRRQDLRRPGEAFDALGVPGSPPPSGSKGPSSFRSTLSDALCMPPPGSAPKRPSNSRRPVSAPVPARESTFSGDEPGVGKGSYLQALAEHKEGFFNASKDGSPSQHRSEAAEQDRTYSLSLTGHEAFSKPAIQGQGVAAWGKQRHSVVEGRWDQVGFLVQPAAEPFASNQEQLRQQRKTVRESSWTLVSSETMSPTEAASSSWNQNGFTPHRIQAIALMVQGTSLVDANDQSLADVAVSATVPVALHSQSKRSRHMRNFTFADIHNQSADAFMASSVEQLPRRRSQAISPSSAASISPVHLSGAFPSGAMFPIPNEKKGPVYQILSMHSGMLPSKAAFSSTGSYRSVVEQASPTSHRGQAATIANPLHDMHGLSSLAEQGSRGFDDTPQHASRHSAPLGSATTFPVRPGPNESFPAPARPPLPSKQRPVSASSLLAATEKVSLQSPQFTVASLDPAQAVPSGAGAAPMQSHPVWSSRADITRTRPGGLDTSTSQTISPIQACSSYDPGVRDVGLSLELMAEEKDCEMVEQLAPETTSAVDDDDMPMQFDEMGRLFFAPTQRRDSMKSASTGSLGVSSVGGRRPYGTWHQSDGSWPAGDGNWLTSTVPSSVENSFVDDPVGSAAGSNMAQMPAQGMSSSIGASTEPSEGRAASATIAVPFSQSPYQLIPGAPIPPSVQQMDDFSEFGQSMPIGSMVEARWRTWPCERAAPAAVTQGPPSACASEQPPPTTPGRARLTVEPYSKTQRNTRPGSSNSTSSRSSSGAMVTAEAAQAPSLAGPTRPRSTLMAAAGSAGPPRSSISPRPSSSSADRPTERKVSLVSALRRARGLSQSAMVGLTSSRNTEASRSSDSIESRRASLVTTQRLTSFDVNQERNQPVSQPSAQMGTSQAAPRATEIGATAIASSTSPSYAKVGFNEVSAALDTLRTFLQQKEAASRPPSRETEEARASMASVGVGSTSDPALPQRTLRRSKGTLPPRGSVLVAKAVEPDRGGAMGHGRRASSGSVMMSESSREQDRLAVLHDLSERIRRLKEASEL